MRFYYFSIFSWMLYGALAVIALALLWAMWTKVLRLKTANPAYWVLVAAVLVGPWVEELWIAYNFDRLCRKDAGIFVNRTVEVDGFYDSTLRSAYELTKAGRYKFAEHPTEDRKGTERVELASVAEREHALAWYAERNPGKERPKDRSVFYPVNEKETIAVLPNGVDAWKIMKLDKPTARYHYRWPHRGTSMAHKIDKIERVVVDDVNAELLARETKYRREAPWFFIGLDRPVMLCPGPGEDPLEKHGSIFNLALKPSKSQ